MVSNAVIRGLWRRSTSADLQQAEHSLLSRMKDKHVVPVQRMVPISNGNHINTIMGGRPDAPPLVLAHGYGAGIGFWFKNFSRLSSRYRVYAVDILGFGRSTRPATVFSGERVSETEDFFVDSLHQWRNSLGLPPFALLGHSFGGYVATAYAAKHPKSVERLILASPFGVSDHAIHVQMQQSAQSAQQPSTVSPQMMTEQQTSESVPFPAVTMTMVATSDSFGWTQQDLKDAESMAQHPPPLRTSIDNAVDTNSPAETQSPPIAASVAETPNPSSSAHTTSSGAASEFATDDQSRVGALFNYAFEHMWKREVTPQDIVKALGPLGSRAVQRVVDRRFRWLSQEEKDELSSYVYHLWCEEGSGEYALAALFQPFGWARSPLIHRLRYLSVPTFLTYGEYDWMDWSQSLALQQSGSNPNLQPVMFIKGVGHQMFLEDPDAFNTVVEQIMSTGVNRVEVEQPPPTPSASASAPQP